jgi:hypothetical protein
MSINHDSKTARETIDHFFLEIDKLEGMDKKTARIIRDLWDQGSLDTDDLLRALENARVISEEYNDSKKA